MSTRIRKQVYIDPEHEEALKRLAEASGRSEADLIRAALDHHISHTAPIKRSYEAWQEIEPFIGKRMKQDSLTGARAWKREDLYDR